MHQVDQCHRVNSTHVIIPRRVCSTWCVSGEFASGLVKNPLLLLQLFADSLTPYLYFFRMGGGTWWFHSVVFRSKTHKHTQVLCTRSSYLHSLQFAREDNQSTQWIVGQMECEIAGPEEECGGEARMGSFKQLEGRYVIKWAGGFLPVRDTWQARSLRNRLWNVSGSRRDVGSSLCQILPWLQRNECWLLIINSQ